MSPHYKPLAGCLIAFTLHLACEASDYSDVKFIITGTEAGPRECEDKHKLIRYTVRCADKYNFYECWLCKRKAEEGDEIWCCPERDEHAHGWSKCLGCKDIQSSERWNGTYFMVSKEANKTAYENEHLRDLNEGILQWEKEGSCTWNEERQVYDYHESDGTTCGAVRTLIVCHGYIAFLPIGRLIAMASTNVPDCPDSIARSEYRYEFEGEDTSFNDLPRGEPLTMQRFVKGKRMDGETAHVTIQGYIGKPLPKCHNYEHVPHTEDELAAFKIKYATQLTQPEKPVPTKAAQLEKQYAVWKCICLIILLCIAVGGLIKLIVCIMKTPQTPDEDEPNDDLKDGSESESDDPENPPKGNEKSQEN